MNAHIKYECGDTETITNVTSFSFDFGILQINTSFDEGFTLKSVKSVSFTQMLSR